MSERLRVLITNDDGVAAPGIRRLALTAAGHGLDVVVAAPDREISGASAALTAVEEGGRIVVTRQVLDGPVEIPAYAVAGSPAYIVRLALRGAFGPPPDVVLSGVNRGANAGTAVLHSGTVGAALTAAADGQRAMAVSLDVLSVAAASAGSGGAALAAVDRVDDERRHWDTPARLALDLLPALTAAPPGTVFNINAPDVPYERLPGLRRATLAHFGQVQITVAESGEGFVRTALRESPDRVEEGTDIAALADGYACVTPIRGVSEAPDVDLP